jgi:hypothetical protein
VKPDVAASGRSRTPVFADPKSVRTARTGLVVACGRLAWGSAGMFIKAKRVRRDNRTYVYLTLVESVRVDGKNTHRTPFPPRRSDGAA